jgi:hypothetical protein
MMHLRLSRRSLGDREHLCADLLIDDRYASTPQACQPLNGMREVVLLRAGRKSTALPLELTPHNEPFWESAAESRRVLFQRVGHF